MTVHILVVALVVGIPLLRVTNVLPEVPAVMAFVAAPPQPPPPPPPPARAAAAQAAPRPEPKPAGALVAPLEAPSEVKPEATTASADLAGVEGGVEGGVPGGVVGGIVGGLMPPPPPPPPPAPPPAPLAPVRIGGQLMAPALTRRVDPVFPDFAAAARLTGVVILEAVVDTEGRVESVTVLRSRHPLLDRAAIEALHQWQYSPLVLNGIPTPFVLTVTFNFSVGP